jgi:hypothetical protein
MVFGDFGRNRSARKLAAEHGLVLDAEKTAPPPFALLELGQRQKVTRRLGRPGSPACVFDFETKIAEDDEHGDPSFRTDRYTCAMTDVDFSAPHTLLLPEQLVTKWTGRAAHERDVQLGDEDFDRRYTVRTSDETFVRTLLDERVLPWVMAGPASGNKTRFEFRGHQVLVRVQRRSLTDYPVILDWLDAFATVVPAAVTEAYSAD